MSPGPEAPPPPPTPAGWYPDPRVPGRRLYWDGTRWTGQYDDAPAPPGPAAPSDPPPAFNKPGRKFYWALGIGAVLVVLLIIGALNDSRDKTSATTATGPTAAAPELGFTSPAASSRVGASVLVRGTVNPPGTPVTVGEIGDRKPATVTGGTWSARVNITSAGAATITATSGSTTRKLNVVHKLTKAELAAERKARAAERERQRKAAEADRLAREREKQDFINAASPIDYKALNKDPNAHIGEKVKIYGKIFQIKQEGGVGFMLIAVTDEGYDIWDDNVWVDYTGDVKSNEDDLITIYGTVEGAKDYDTQIGGSTTVPQVTAEYIEE